MKYQIEVSEEQARIISEALDLYMRVRLGQVEVIIEPWRFAIRGDQQEQTAERLLVAERLVGDAKMALTGFTPTASFGIGHDAVPNDARIAQDIRQTIRHRMAWDRRPEGGHTADFHEPMSWGKQPLPKVSKVEEG